jgi:hypothetical protein
MGEAIKKSKHLTCAWGQPSQEQTHHFLILIYCSSNQPLIAAMCPLGGVDNTWAWHKLTALTFHLCVIHGIIRKTVNYSPPCQNQLGGKVVMGKSQ